MLVQQFLKLQLVIQGYRLDLQEVIIVLITNDFEPRVTGIDPTNGNIYYEANFQNYGKSEIGTPNPNNVARPLDIYNIKIPKM
jgi:hypothetical protein